MRVAIATSIALFAGLSASAEASPWQATTASTLDKGGVAVGLFAPLRYGITDDLDSDLADEAVADSPDHQLYAWTGWLLEWTVAALSAHE